MLLDILRDDRTGFHFLNFIKARVMQTKQYDKQQRRIILLGNLDDQQFLHPFLASGTRLKTLQLEANCSLIAKKKKKKNHGNIAV